MTAGQAEIRIIGIGNTFRSDDGAGIAIARSLRQRLPEGVALLEQSGEGTALLEAWKGARVVVLVDAVQSGAAPGTIHRLDAYADPIPPAFFRYSTHAFSVAEAVQLARVLSQLPPRVIVYGIEGRNFSAGEGLSAEVAEASAKMAARVLDEVRSLEERETTSANSASCENTS
jgi:hydrogenase maturation protease